MKKIIEQLEKQSKSLRLIVEKREDYVMSRSEKWQESEKCEEYEDITYTIQDKADELDFLIDELKELA